MPWPAWPRCCRPTKPSADTVKQDVARYEQLWGSAEVRAYYEQLRERFKAEILVPQSLPTHDPASWAQSAWGISCCRAAPGAVPKEKSLLRYA